MSVRNYSRQQGFTLPELLVAGALLLVCIGAVLIILRPTNYGPEHRNAKRRLDLVALIDAISAYKIANGSLPPSIAEHDEPIATTGNGQGLCDDLVPAFIPDIPLDPVRGDKVDNALCSADGQVYDSGYRVRVESGRVILSAPAAEAGENISLERWFAVL